MPSLYKNNNSKLINHDFAADHSHHNHHRSSLDGSSFATSASNSDDAINYKTMTTASTSTTTYNANHWQPTNHYHGIKTSSSTSSWNRNNSQQSIENMGSNDGHNIAEQRQQQQIQAAITMDPHHSSTMQDLLPSIDKHYSNANHNNCISLNSVTSPILNTTGTATTPNNNSVTAPPSSNNNSLISTIYNSPTYYVSPTAAAVTNTSTTGTAASGKMINNCKYYLTWLLIEALFPIKSTSIINRIIISMQHRVVTQHMV
ncbi:hypothetical protein BDF20DRAFT_290614 [Mycotypha africana]|uniref:uncharacterized protein n=1 Tax=Mycotypha africana TaxID=64632 RepID=UPI0023010EE9|nr:uncharacterized protein BDF20DRAFT_290614 [Mycotypha africana]KAI8987811.1 hypothetical protein BDF20DRAFT_290614 [Mycotypha africana]